MNEAKLVGFNILKVCTKCAEEKELISFHEKKEAKDGRCTQCKECLKVYNKQSREDNREQRKRDGIRWRNSNPSYQKKYLTIWHKNNPEKVALYNSQRRASKLSATPLWADVGAIERRYIIASFLTKKLGETYHVDHIVPLRGKHICGLHVEYNLDVIPATDNLRKGNSFNGK